MDAFQAAQAYARQALAPQRHLSRHYFVRALCALSAYSDPAEAVEGLNLSSTTADEQALSLLSSRSRDFVPALEDLRQKAVDRELLLALGAPSKADAPQAELSSDGESTVHEFGFSSESDDEAGRQRDLPLVLPKGWRVDQVVQGKSKRRVRVFVDPDGQQYKTEAAAKVAVADFRRAENMTQMLKSRFSARFGTAASGKPLLPVSEPHSMARANSGNATPESVASTADIGMLHRRDTAMSSQEDSAAAAPQDSTPRSKSDMPSFAGSPLPRTESCYSLDGLDDTCSLASPISKRTRVA